MTQFLRSYFHTERDDLKSSLYTTVRAGHLVADRTHHIERETLAGHELIYCLRGQGVTRIAGHVHRVRAQQLFWVCCWSPHQYNADPKDPWELYWVRIEGPGLDALGNLLNVERNPVFSSVARPSVEPGFLEIFQILESPGPAAPAQMHAALAGLLAQLYANRFHEFSPDTTPIPGALEKPLQRMRLHCGDPLTLKELAAMAGMSVTHFTRLFRHSMGTSPIDWLRRERINLAKRRLIDTDEPVKEIARQCGYRDPYFFSKDFHRLVGAPPTRYRDQERGRGGAEPVR